MLDIITLLEHYGADDVPEGKWRSMRCPWHNDRQASASVWTDEGAFNCHVCGTLYEAIATYEGISIEKARQRAKEIAGGSNSHLSGSGQPSTSLLGFKRHIRERRPYVPFWLRGKSSSGS